jgi:hypothetical protein
MTSAFSPLSCTWEHGDAGRNRWTTASLDKDSPTAARAPKKLTEIFPFSRNSYCDEKRRSRCQHISPDIAAIYG